MFQGFQSSVTPLMDGIIMLHNYVMFYLVVIFVFVFSFLFRTVRLSVRKPWSLRKKLFFFLELRLARYKYLSWLSAFLKRWGSKKRLSWYMLYFSRNLTHATSLEVIWTTIPGLVLLSLAFPSFALLYTMDEALDPDVTLKIVGHQWYWSYSWYTFDEFDEFDSYMLATSDLKEGDLRLLEVDNFLPFPVNANVCVLVTSDDVLHSWAVPSFGIKIDCVPGRLNQVNLNIYRPGVFYGQCSELCGVNHGFMPIEVRAYDFFDFSCIISANPSLREKFG